MKHGFLFVFIYNSCIMSQLRYTQIHSYQDISSSLGYITQYISITLAILVDRFRNIVNLLFY